MNSNDLITAGISFSQTDGHLLVCVNQAKKTVESQGSNITPRQSGLYSRLRLISAATLPPTVSGCHYISSPLHQTEDAVSRNTSDPGACKHCKHVISIGLWVTRW